MTTKTIFLTMTAGFGLIVGNTLARIHRLDEMTEILKEANSKVEASLALPLFQPQGETQQLRTTHTSTSSSKHQYISRPYTKPGSPSQKDKPAGTVPTTPDTILKVTPQDSVPKNGTATIHSFGHDADKAYDLTLLSK